MAAPWIGSRVRFAWFAELGDWQVTGRDETGWLEIVSISPAGKALAGLGSDGKLWVQQSDLTRLPDQEETLL